MGRAALSKQEIQSFRDRLVEVQIGQKWQEHLVMQGDALGSQVPEALMSLRDTHRIVIRSVYEQVGGAETWGDGLRALRKAFGERLDGIAKNIERPSARLFDLLAVGYILDRADDDLSAVIVGESRAAPDPNLLASLILGLNIVILN